MSEFRIAIIAEGIASSAWEQHQNMDRAGRSAVRSALTILKHDGSFAPVIAEAIVEEALTGQVRRFRISIEESR